MTHATPRDSSLSPVPRSPDRRRTIPAAAPCLLGGVLAAGLGLGAFAVLVMVLWISSPYPDSGPGAALKVAAGLWLLAHGTELVRPDTLSGVPAPVGLIPLLLVALPFWLVHRAVRVALEEQAGEEGEPEGPQLTPRSVFTAVTCGYLLVAVAATTYSTGGPLSADLLSASWHLPGVAAAAAGAGVWSARGRPYGPLPPWLPGSLRKVATRPRCALAFRAGSAGALTLLGGGALLVGVSLAWHAGDAQESFLRLTGVWSGRFAVLLLALALIPNAAVWGASYGLGPGFALGSGAVVSPLGFTGPPALPRFPLLAALPPADGGSGLAWAALAVPVLAGSVVGWFVLRTAVPRFAHREESWTWRETAWGAVCASLVCACAMAGLAGAAAGPLGSRALSAFGPVWWQAGVAALAWSLLLSVPLALGVRAWRLREPRGLFEADAPQGSHGPGSVGTPPARTGDPAGAPGPAVDEPAAGRGAQPEAARYAGEVRQAPSAAVKGTAGTPVHPIGPEAHNGGGEEAAELAGTSKVGQLVAGSLAHPAPAVPAALSPERPPQAVVERSGGPVPSLQGLPTGARTVVRRSGRSVEGGGGATP